MDPDPRVASSHHDPLRRRRAGGGVPGTAVRRQLSGLQGARATLALELLRFRGGSRTFAQPLVGDGLAGTCVGAERRGGPFGPGAAASSSARPRRMTQAGSSKLDPQDLFSMGATAELAPWAPTRRVRGPGLIEVGVLSLVLASCAAIPA